MREGTLFEFGSAKDLLAAADALRELGLDTLETFTPFAIPELDAKIGLPRTRIPRAVLVAAAFGCALAFAIIWGTNAYDYPLDVGGRPVNSVPADIPIAFETTVLFGSLTAFLSVLLSSGLPRLHTPVFEVPGIESASLDHFWIGVERRESVDAGVRTRMLELGALSVRELRAP